MEYFWKKKGWEKEDPHLEKIKKMPFQRQFPFIPSEKGLYIIRGPRQIGKSSWLKTILAHYSHLNEKCFYLSCENISDNKDLAEILKSIRDCKIVLLDEISFVQNWDRAIKHEIDRGKHHILVLTGSHAYDLKKGSDQMPGRFEAGGEFFLMPMLFEEFYEARLQAGWCGDNIVDEIELFFKVGGFPDAVAEAGVKGILPLKSIETYWRWLKGDIVKLGKQESYLEEILIQIALCVQNPIGYQTLAKKTSISSHHTVKEYLSILESCFATRQLLAIDMNTGTYRFKKDKKIYFTDPLLYQMAYWLAGRKVPDNLNEKMAEMVANEFLSRTNRRFGYFSNKKGEIDFILPGQWAREVKWSSDATNLSKAYIELICPDKKVWLKTNFLT